MSNPIDKAFREGIIPGVVQLIRTATSLKAQDVGFHKSLDKGLAQETDNVSSKLMNIGNDIIETITNEEVELKSDAEIRSSNWKVVSNALDTLFERADVLFDEVKNGPKQDLSKNFTYLEESNNGSKDDTKNLGKKMQKPQLQFKVPINNEESEPFKPKLAEKPNALKSIEESIQLIQPGKVDDTGLIDPPFYPHPYELEINSQPYPESILLKSDPIPSKPWEDQNVEWVDKPEQVAQLVEALSKSTVISVDLEHHDYRTYYGLVCLMQISNREKDWIIDTLTLRDDLTPLNEVFTNPNIVKVFHGAFMDIIWLQRDLGLYIVSLFDTYHASRKLGFPKFSLAYLLETFAHFKTSKKYQLADWRIRPLPNPMLAYARSDTHFLLNIFDQLKNKLLERNDDKMKEVLFESRKVARRRFEFTKFRPLTQNSNNLVTCPVMSSNPQEPYLSIVVQHNIPFHIKPVVAVLYDWRDKIARDLDESVRYIMSNQALALLATLSHPVNEKKVLSIPAFITESVRRNAEELANLINETLNQAENNDWSMVDKIHGVKDQVASTGSMIPESLDVQAQTFNDLYADNEQLLHSDHSNHHTVKSKVFAESDGQTFSVRFERQPVKISVDDITERNEYRNQEFEKLKVHNDPKRFEVLEVEAQIQIPPQNNEHPQESESAPMSTQTSSEQIVAHESRDDIITLRNTKKQKKTASKRKHEDDQPVLNYSEMDSIMTGKSDGVQKKRRFDPYSKSSVGPKAARKQKQFHNGRSSTFRK